jgi:hypothetical protein
MDGQTAPAALPRELARGRHALEPPRAPLAARPSREYAPKHDPADANGIKGFTMPIGLRMTSRLRPSFSSFQSTGGRLLLLLLRIRRECRGDIGRKSRRAKVASTVAPHHQGSPSSTVHLSAHSWLPPLQVHAKRTRAFVAGAVSKTFVSRAAHAKLDSADGAR